MPDEEKWKLVIHLNGGGSIPTVIDGEELEHANVDDIDEYVDSALNFEGRPKWVTLGSVKFHPQAITAIELEEM